MLATAAPADRATAWWTRALRTGEAADVIPAWAEFVDAAIARAGTTEAPVGRGSSRRVAEAHLVPVVAPFAALALDRAGVAADHVVPAAALAAARGDLEAVLAGLAARAVVTTVAATDPDTGFVAAVAAIAAPAGLRRLLAAYPVLGRLLATTATNRAAALAEVLGRLRTDSALLGVAERGGLTAVDQGAGDTHHGGRTVGILTFADASRLVHKPRPADIDVALATLLDRVGVAAGLDLQGPTVIARDGYFWSEFVAAAPCPDRGAVDRFYTRLGALTAVAHLTGTTDLHCENVVARGEHPVLVDVETVLHPDTGRRADPDPARRLLDASVLRTALLPVYRTGPDLSGVGGDPAPAGATGEVADWADAGTRGMHLVRRATAFAEAANRPTLDGRRVEPSAHADAFVTGLRRGYDGLLAIAAQLPALVDGLATTSSRTILRPSAVYARLLDETTHPDVLADAETRDAALRALAGRGTRRPAAVVAAEVAQLWDGDIPVFGTDPHGRTVRAPDGAAVLDVDAPALDAARARIAALSPSLRDVQVRIAAAALATRVPARPAPAAGTGTGPGSGEAPLVGAVHIADRLIALSPGDQRRSNWLGLHRDAVGVGLLPLGADLADGYPGVALFLAELAAATGSARHAEHARRVVVDLPRLVADLAERPDGAAVLGPGLADGAGGLTVAVHRLGRLLDVAELRAVTPVAVRLVVAAARSCAARDVRGGRAGALLALLAIVADGAADPVTAAGAADSAAELADTLAGEARDRAVTADAGTAWALARAGRVLHRPDLTAAAGQELARVASPAGGTGLTPGLGDLVRAHAELDPGSAATQRLRELVLDRPVADDTLSRGAAGCIELGTGVRSTAHRRRREALLARLAAVAADAPRELACAESVPQPGLRRGVAGIGRTLLRNAPVPQPRIRDRAAETTPNVPPTQPHRKDAP